ncbi:MAG: response regulator [Planctomycetes bacterium]|nr:response regulator [Planctomycetota bacterium]
MSNEAEPKKTVLIVEDEQDVTDFLVMVLEDNGYKAVCATNGLEGLEKARTEKPDLISLDINLPEKSGVKLYRELKADSALCKIPVIMVTGVPAQFEQFISSRKQVPPPDGYVAKPFDGKKYMDAVHKVLGG